MKWLIFNKALFSIFLLSITIISAYGQDFAVPNRVDTVYITDTVYIEKQQEELLGYEKKRKRIETRWKNIIPKYGKAQFAGSMGLISIGTGWSYGKNKQWESDLLFGFLPKYNTSKNKVTMTVKQNFIPWTVKLNDSFELKPFSTGLYLNTIFGEHFWGRQPGKYPSSYYTFSTKFRINAFVGQGWVYKLDTSKKVFCESITFFYEVSTNELYVVSAINNSYLKPKDYLGLSLGLKFQFL